MLEDVRCGLHSGIPACCIAWYLGPWRLVGYGRAPRIRRTYFELLDGFGHIACPLCFLKGRVVEVRECDCHSAGL
jgi:hypothetical protein